METSRSNLFSLALLFSLGWHFSLPAADCNRNGIPDRREIEEGTSPDCNGNGVPDGCDVSPLLGFSFYDLLPLGGERLNLQALEAADLDGDGRPDVAVLLEDQLVVKLNAGDGLFSDAAPVSAGKGVASMAIGDLEGDQNLGKASFQPPAVLFSAYLATSLLAEDLDGDGDIDFGLAVPRLPQEKGYIQVHENQGDGSFVPGNKFYAGFQPAAIIAADLNGDGQKDLISANEGSHTLSILFNLGGGAFAQQMEIPVARGPAAVLAADLDGDQDLDLVTANSLSGNLSLLFNDGNGRFRDPLNLPAGESPRALASADLDGDGLLDLAVANFQSGDLSILLNRGQGSFGEAEKLLAAPYPLHLLAQDLDGDGDPELVLTSQSGDDFHYSPQGAILLIPNRREDLHSRDRNKNGVPDECENSIPFKRGDFNQDAGIDIGDPMALLQFLFLGAGAPPCLKAGDANDDSRINITDAIGLILHLFAGRGPLPEPFSACAPDPTPDPSSCEAFHPCP